MLLDGLVGFIGGGLKAGESAIVIATAEHLKTLDERLQISNVDVAMARSRDQYIALEAEEALARFMANQWPDNCSMRIQRPDLPRRIHKPNLCSTL